MKVLIITYYWPPAGGPGVQRWLKFVKYLQQFGLEPVVYTVENPRYPITDSSLENEIPKGVEVLRLPIREPNNLFVFFTKKKSSQSAGFLNPNPGLFGRFTQYIRANFFIPDARKFWIKPSVRYLKKYLESHPVDMIITTGPPHSVHLIGLALKEDLGVPWISDFRDPWTAIDYFDQLPLTKKSLAKHHTLEKKVLKKSDAVLVVGETMKKNFDPYAKQVYVLTNGYDTSQDEKKGAQFLDSRFSITHVGAMNADRNPIILWEVLAAICKENSDFKSDLEIKLIGHIAPQVLNSITGSGLENVERLGYLKHAEIKSYQEQSQVLLLAVNQVASAKGIVTGKIFEYLQAKRPILAIGPTDGDLATILQETSSGEIVDFNDAVKLKEVVLDLYRNFKEGNTVFTVQNIEQFHRKNLTEELSKIIKNTLENHSL
ncbi:glycosyl transferase family 1 [Polaribacter pacificus]|uniref:Glycosyl transferase family 1 n=1 Tax=Polaribacter pacificus TaxID=1775173 RepID=A0A917HTL0_9FLAO|nr:glycosyltransferase family 4 protein [Polaribacter pacificus]GGG88906.1 glycosyl transferase family 1 [Polaribacter pacificus]